MRMINPIESLAFSMHANRGVYALLLGSGVSRSAGIPTGWEITIDLIRRAAALKQEDCEPEPAAWFLGAYQNEPNYSELLDVIAKTPAERQQLLRGYLEPSEQDRENGLKVPTRAHRAIANLIKTGYIRVVLTTNFDRLLEIALQDVGVNPVVLSTADHIDGALPLIHTQCTVVKVHGDYLDPRILNTVQELSAYPGALNSLLDRILDEFGLVVAGWSGDWDEALRAAITRAPSRRFSTYWASRGEPSEMASELIKRRGATVIGIEDADSFFAVLDEHVTSLDKYSRPHPLSTEIAVSTLKKFLAEPKLRIELNDLVTDVAGNVDSAIRSDSFNSHTSIDGKAILSRLRFYERLSETLIAMGFVAGIWSDDEQLKPWLKALAKLSFQPSIGGHAVWIEFARYPGTLLFYSIGLGAVTEKKWSLLYQLFNIQIERQYGDDLQALKILPIWKLFSAGQSVMKLGASPD